MIAGGQEAHQPFRIAARPGHLPQALLAGIARKIGNQGGFGSHRRPGHPVDQTPYLFPGNDPETTGIGIMPDEMHPPGGTEFRLQKGADFKNNPLNAGWTGRVITIQEQVFQIDPERTRHQGRSQGSACP